MNFFKNLLETGLQNVIIELKQDSTGEITVMVTPKTIAKDSALKTLTTLYMTGPVDEVDEMFFDQFTKPLENTATLISNVEKYEMQTEKAAKNTDAEKKTKEENKKLQSELEKSISGLKTPEEWIKNKEKIQLNIDALTEKDPSNKMISKVSLELKSNIAKGESIGLFGLEEESNSQE